MVEVREPFDKIDAHKLEDVGDPKASAELVDAVRKALGNGKNIPAPGTF